LINRSLNVRPTLSNLQAEDLLLFSVGSLPGASLPVQSGPGMDNPLKTVWEVPTKGKCRAYGERRFEHLNFLHWS